MAFANASTQAHTITLLDPFPVGGVVWNPDQNPKFIANTISQQLTLFTDNSIPKQQPGLTGPNLYEWVHHQAATYLDTHTFKNEAAFRDEIPDLESKSFFLARHLLAYMHRGILISYNKTRTQIRRCVFKQSKATPVRAITDGRYEINSCGRATTHCCGRVLSTHQGIPPRNQLMKNIQFQVAADKNADWQYIAPMQPSAAPIGYHSSCRREMYSFVALALSFF